MDASSELMTLKVAVARRMLARAGCESGVAGQLSARSPDGDGLVVTPYEYSDETRPDHLTKVSFDRKIRFGPKIAAPAVAFHAAFYLNRPEINCVVHTHSHYTMVIATTGKCLGMYNDASSLFYDDQVVYVDDRRPPVDGRRLCLVAEGKHVVILKNHGAIFLGETIEVATIYATFFEKCARIHLDVAQLGGDEHHPAHSASLQREYLRRVCPQEWDAGVRRLHRDEPELFAGADLDALMSSTREHAPATV